MGWELEDEGSRIIEFRDKDSAVGIGVYGLGVKDYLDPRSRQT